MNLEALFRRLDAIEWDLDRDNWMTESDMRREEGYTGLEDTLEALFPLVEYRVRMQLQRILARAERLHYEWGRENKGEYKYYLNGDLQNPE